MLFEPVDRREFLHTKLEGTSLSFYPDGTPTVSVSTFLGITKPQSDIDSLEQWRQRVGPEQADIISRNAADRGTNLHAFLESTFTGEPSKRPVTPGTKMMFDSLFPDIKKNLTKILGIEIPLYSKILGIHGICDCIGIWDGELSIIDWKTSTRPKRREWIDDYFLQTALYAFMFKEMYGELPEKMVIGIFCQEESRIYEDRLSRIISKLKPRINIFKSITENKDNLPTIFKR